MAVVKCAFCGKEQEDVKGIYFVKNDGNTLYFSSSKCLKNYKLGRDRRKIRWADAFHEQRSKKIERMKKTKEALEKKK